MIKLLSRSLIILSLTFLFAKKPVIAISNISSENLSDFHVKLFFNRIESEMVNMGVYDVTSRQEVAKILNEQKFQNSGCTDQQCAAEIGRILNADLMLLSNILYDKESKYINLNLKLIDVETAKITTAISKNKRVSDPTDMLDNISTYLLDLHKKAVENLEHDKLLTSLSTYSNDPNVGWISATSIPDDAKLLIGEHDLDLPVDFYELTKGDYFYSVNKPGYKTQNGTINIEAKKHKELEFNLEAINRAVAARRSLLFPGYGQYYSEQYYKGALFSVLTVAGLKLTADSFLDYQLKSDEYVEAEELYQSSDTDVIEKSIAYEEAFNNLEKSKNQVIVLSSIVAALWTWNVIDIYLSIPKHNPSHLSSIQLGINARGHLTANVNF